MTDYTVMEHHDLNAVIKAVKDWQAKGWVCQGGIACAVIRRTLPHESPALLWSQAMVKVNSALDEGQ